MAAIFAMENEPAVDRLILLAPAINLMPSANMEEKTISVPAWVYHGTNDEVIPFEGVETAARRIFRNLSFHRVDDDHFLHRTFQTIEWDKLL